jgi:peptidyl-prolyl cis-trans isomerase C
MTFKLEKSLRIIAIMLMLLFPTTSALGDTKNPTEKVSAVNDIIITSQDVENKMIEIKQQFIKQGRPVDEQKLTTLKNQIIDSLIEEELLFQESQKKDIKIEQATVDTSLANTQNKFKSEEDFLNALKEMNLNKADFLLKIRRGLSTRKLIDTQIGDKIQIPEKESQTFYNTHPKYFKIPEQVKASHILIKLESNADKATRSAAFKKMEEIQKQLQNGEEFASLAKKFSEGPSNVKGGDLGYFGPGQMVKPFEDAAFALKPGETSKIVETRFGLHLIQLTDKKPEGTIDYKDTKERIIQHLKQERMKQDIIIYIQDLKKRAKIEKF